MFLELDNRSFKCEKPNLLCSRVIHVSPIQMARPLDTDNVVSGTLVSTNHNSLQCLRP